ncbi:MAG: dihydrolipoyl dehydrogenase [Candidatus Omnitrophota bacterium]
MDYDLVIIGAGWAGFNAAIKAKQAGLKTALIENEQVGGTCLNRGCIPTKTLIQSAKVFNLIKKSKIFSIETSEPKINFSELLARKDKIVQELRQGMEFMLKGVDIFKGQAEFLTSNQIKIGQDQLNSKSVIIATGSKPRCVKTLKFDQKKIVSSDDLLVLKEIPKSLLVIGGGVIGCEFASLFHRLGSQVCIIEKKEQLLPGEDKDLSRKLESLFKKKGIKVVTNAEVSDAKFGINNYELVLVSVGRAPQIENLGLEKIGIETEFGAIKTDEYLRTNIAHIFAAGDCTGQIMLAHFAAYQGKAAVENVISGNNLRKCGNSIVPNCIFTDPEAASVGINEEKAELKGIKLKINKFDFLGSGMARILDEKDGFIKIFSDEKDGRVLGASIIGPYATELVNIFSLAITNSLHISQIQETIFTHPSLSESIAQALK